MTSNETENPTGKNNRLLLLCSVIIAAALIISASVFARGIAERPLTGSFSGSLLADSSYYYDIMEIDGLMNYLAIYPTSKDEENYDNAMNQLQTDLQNSIVNGDWPEFPFVQLNGRLYFSRQAVDDWFTQQGKQQLIIN
ncbi:MAG: hypothetical protein ACOX88_07545 [Christensenellales bacterium]|jgi:hypothetical protein